MKRILYSLNQRITAMLRSEKFFYGIVALLLFQAVWIALTARYPQAFDENYHLGLIQLHAQQWLPFFTYQPSDASVYGAVVRDGSYFYHYLFSLPYRLIVQLTSSVTVQVIVLRLCNVGLFVAGLFVYRRLFDLLGISRVVRNVVLLIFVLLPIVPLLAGQINYDNLIFIFNGLIFVYVTQYVRLLRTTPRPPIPLSLLLKIIIVGGLGSVTKYTFTPVFAAVIIGLLILTIRAWRRSSAESRPRLDYRWSVGFTLLIVVGFLTICLCVERYGVNLVAYHTPAPACDKVIGISECQSYSPWARDYLFAATYPRPTFHGMLVYLPVWIHRMVYESMFSVTSYLYEPWNTVTYKAFLPLPIANAVAWMVGSIATLAVILFRRQIKRNHRLMVLVVIALFYTLVLFLQNFAMYHHTGEAVAIHGRYLVPIYPVLLLPLALGFQALLRQMRLRQYQGILVAVVVLLFVQGGGLTVWSLRSDSSWYWQQIPAANQANRALQSVLSKVIYH